MGHTDFMELHHEEFLSNKLLSEEKILVFESLLLIDLLEIGQIAKGIAAS